MSKKQMKGWKDLDFRPKPKENKVNVGSLMHELNCLKTKFDNVVSEYESQVKSLQDQIASLKQNYEKNINDIINLKLTEVKQMMKGFVSFPSGELEKYPMIIKMLLFSLTGETSEEFEDFCKLIYFHNTKVYDIISDFFPIIPKTRIKNSTMQQRKEFEDDILHIENIPKILDSHFKEKIPVVIAGDAASVKPIFESSLNSIYLYMLLPLIQELRPLPIHAAATKSGSSNKTIVEKFFKICDIVEKQGFSVDFVSTDGDKGFDPMHFKWFKQTAEPILKEEISFKEKIQKLSKSTKIPVSDLLHLLKNARSHMLMHILCLDPETFKCLNMYEFERASELGPIISDKSNIAAMKDSYCLKLFSWDTMIKLLSKQRFDGAFYTLPFAYMLQATRSKTLSVDSRLELLECAINYFSFYLKHVKQSKTDDFFTPTYKSSSIGTLFSDEIFLIRCINTCLAFSVALIKYGVIPFARIGTHDIECFFGKMRIFSYYNHTFKNAIKSFFKSSIINQICDRFDYQIKITKRDNEGGVTIDKDILAKNPLDFNFRAIADTLFLLFKSIKLNKEQIEVFQNNVNEYSCYLINNPFSNPKITIQSIFSGTAPHYRYVSNSYLLSLLPLPTQCNRSSPLTFFQNDKSVKKKTKKITTFQWFSKLMCTITSLSFNCSPIEKIKFPKLDKKVEGSEVFNIVGDWLSSVFNTIN